MARHKVKAKCSRCDFNLEKTAKNVEDLFSAMIDLGCELPGNQCPLCKTILNIESTIKKPFKGFFDNKIRRR